MNFLKIFIKITAFLFLSFTLNIIAWVPSLILENIVNFTIIILYIIPVFFIYKTIRTSYYQQKKKELWKSVLYTLSLLSYMGVFSILMIGISYSKSSYIESYNFDDKIFYVYQNINLSYEVSVKDPLLPIRSIPIASFDKTLITLKTDNQYLYAKGKGIEEKIYDLKKNISIKSLKNTKENNE